MNFAVKEYLKRIKNPHAQFLNPPYPRPQRYEKFKNFNFGELEKDITTMKTEISKIRAEISKLECKHQNSNSQEIFDDFILDSSDLLDNFEESMKIFNSEMKMIKEL